MNDPINEEVTKYLNGAVHEAVLRIAEVWDRDGAEAARRFLSEILKEFPRVL